MGRGFKISYNVFTEREKKEVLEHAKLIKKERKTKSFMDKTKPTQEQKISGIIGSTGK